MAAQEQSHYPQPNPQDQLREQRRHEERQARIAEAQDREHSGERLIRMPDVKHVTGLSEATIWRLVAAKKFPAPRMLGARARGWLLSEVNEYLRNLPRLA